MYPAKVTSACIASAPDSRPTASPSSTRLPVMTLVKPPPSRVKLARSVAPVRRVTITASAVIAVPSRWPSWSPSAPGWAACPCWPARPPASSVAGTILPSDVQDQPVLGGLEAGLVQMVQHVGRHVGEDDAQAGELAAVSGQVRVPEVVGDVLVAGVGLRVQQVAASRDRAD